MRMLLFEQLELFAGIVGRAVGFAPFVKRGEPIASSALGDDELETHARTLVRALGAHKLAAVLRVEWNPRLRTAAGRADFQKNLISLNPRLRDHGAAEIERTLLHELAHLLAHFRAGRSRINAHGAEWRQACADLGIAGEKRCHTLPFPAIRRRPRFLYRCPECAREFPRVRRIRRALACLECCRRFNRGRFEARFRLRLVRSESRR